VAGSIGTISPKPLFEDQREGDDKRLHSRADHGSAP
jgi:hypothetical protein